MLVLAAGVAGLVPLVDVWVAAIPIPIALLLTPRPASAGSAAPARERGRGVATSNAATSRLSVREVAPVDCLGDAAALTRASSDIGYAQLSRTNER
jgi:hypothetical protein